MTDPNPDPDPTPPEATPISPETLEDALRLAEALVFAAATPVSPRALANLLRRLPSRILAPPIDDNIGALRRQQTSDGKADSLG